MGDAATNKRPLAGDLGMLAVLALGLVIFHTLTNGQYGFHRDELATIDDGRFPAWGYVAYPPVTPLIARLAFALFGPSLVGLRFFAALAQALALVFAGLMARELGGRRPAQIMAACAAATSPVALNAGALFQYVSLDYLWWVLAAYFMIRLLASEDPRWWLGVGSAIGLGMMTKYTIAFLAAGIAAGVLLTPARRYLRSGWLWCGAALSLVIFAPNLIWQIEHHFVSLDFLRSIHERDIRIGRTSGFLSDQLKSTLFVLPLWLPGLYYYLVSKEGARFRAVAWMFLVPMALFIVSQGRGYYAAPEYPMLLAAGAVVAERWSRLARGLAWAALVFGGMAFAAFLLPLAPVNSSWWHLLVKNDEDFAEEVGWPELVETVAGIRNSLPAEDRSHLAILTGNYGEAGAIDLYGPAYGLPPARSGINSYWSRGYGDPPPDTLIVVGLSRSFLERNFASCELAGHITNRYGVANEETVQHPDIFVCRRLRRPWPEFWQHFRYYG